MIKLINYPNPEVQWTVTYLWSLVWIFSLLRWKVSRGTNSSPLRDATWCSYSKCWNQTNYRYNQSALWYWSFQNAFALDFRHFKVQIKCERGHKFIYIMYHIKVLLDIYQLGCGPFFLSLVTDKRLKGLVTLTCLHFFNKGCFYVYT